MTNLLKRLQFYLKASNSKGHGTHSPLVYHFITEILNDTRNFYAYQEIDALKNKLISDKRKINISGKETSVSSFVKTSLPTKYNQLLFRMVAYYKPSYILEIGSSLGITTAYLASPDKKKGVHTIESNEPLAIISLQTVSSLALPNTSQSIGNIRKPFSEIPERKYGFILINHPNWESEEQIKDIFSIVEEDAIVIFVGINKNAETKLVWNHLISNLNKSISVNLFNFGIIFLKKEVLKKQQFTIRF